MLLALSLRNQGCDNASFHTLVLFPPQPPTRSIDNVPDLDRIFIAIDTIQLK
jgi:hypothetical protein